MSTRPTMADVASAAGVSTMSVSYTYNQPSRVSAATRERVHAAASTLGYSGPHRGAQSLRRGKTNNLGVVLTEKLTYSFEDPQARAFLSGIAEACLDTDTGLVLLPNTRMGVDLSRVRDAQVDGFVVWTTVVGDPLLDVAVATGKPVCVQGGSAHPGAQLIGIDDAEAARTIGAAGVVGAHSPAVLSFPRDRNRVGEIVLGPDPADALFPVTAARLTGYRRAVIAAGYEWSDTPVAFVPANSRADGAAYARILLRDQGADSILATSDELALGVIDTAAELDIAVPDQLAVTGWDDSASAAASGLTTVAQSLYDQGFAAARWILGTAPTVPDARWSLVARSSTRALRAQWHG